jgi:hypothetical protein
MKTYLVFTALLLSNALAACEYMEGKWSSNKELSMEYNYSLASLDKSAISILEQIFGYLKIEIIGNNYHQLYAPTINVNIEGRTYPHSFEEIKHKITYLECSKELVTINHPVDGIGTVHFDGPDIYWTSPLGTWREYFVRTQ